MNSDTRIDESEDTVFTDKQMDNALIAFLCGLCIALAMLFSAFARGCNSEPMAAYSMCEECGAIITDADHGRCQGSEVAYGK